MLENGCKSLKIWHKVRNLFFFFKELFLVVLCIRTFLRMDDVPFITKIFHAYSFKFQRGFHYLIQKKN